MVQAQAGEEGDDWEGALGGVVERSWSKEGEVDCCLTGVLSVVLGHACFDAGGRLLLVGGTTFGWFPP